MGSGMEREEPSLDPLRSAVELACQPQNSGLIEKGRKEVLTFPRLWVLKHIEQVAMASLDLSDYWEYRRFLELIALLDPGLLGRYVTVGLSSTDADVRESAEDFRAKWLPSLSRQRE